MTNLRSGSLYRTELLHLLGKDQPFGRVLDVGCNDGYFLSRLKSDSKIGVDLAPSRRIEDLDIVCADGRFLPFPDQRYDFVYALDIIEHIEDDFAFTQSLYRVLAPGGTIILTTPSEDIRIFPPFLTKWVSLKWGHYIRKGYTPQKLLSFFFQKDLNVQVSQIAAPSYRSFYLFARLLQPLLPAFVHRWVIHMARADYSRQGKHGFLMLEATKKHI